MDRWIFIGDAASYLSIGRLPANEQTTQMTMTTNELAASDRVEFLVADVRDKESVLKATRDITCCFHLVSIISLYGRRRLTHEVNVEGTRNMLDVR